MAFRIVVIGSLNVDMVTRTKRIPNPGETLTADSFSIGWGGKGANQAIAVQRLSRLGDEATCAVKMVGAVGDDHYGAELLKSLQNEGIDVSGVKRVEKCGTGTATILVEEETGENRILVTPGANATLSEDHVWPGYNAKDGWTGNTHYGDITIFQLECPLHAVIGHMRKAHAAYSKVVSSLRRLRQSLIGKRSY
jgi:ribokinase